jgi:single-strand DNA-binding protein
MSQVVTIIGNLTADPELRFTPQGKATAKFSVATAERFKNPQGEWDQRNLTYWNIVAWEQLAENLADTIAKGDKVIVYGKAYTTSWEDKTTGEKRSRMEVTATEVAVALSRVSAKLTKSTRGVPAVNVNESNPWETEGLSKGGGWATSPSDDIPPF